MPRPLPSRAELEKTVPPEILDTYFKIYDEIRHQAGMPDKEHLQYLLKLADFIHHRFCVAVEFLGKHQVQVEGPRYKKYLDKVGESSDYQHLEKFLGVRVEQEFIRLLNSEILFPDPYDSTVTLPGVSLEDRSIINACIIVRLAPLMMTRLVPLQVESPFYVHVIGDAIFGSAIVYSASHSLKIPQLVEEAAKDRAGKSHRKLGKTGAEATRIIKQAAKKLLKGRDRLKYIWGNWKNRPVKYKREPLALGIYEQLQKKDIQIKWESINTHYLGLPEIRDELNKFIEEQEEKRLKK